MKKRKTIRELEEEVERLKRFIIITKDVARRELFELENEINRWTEE